MTHTGVFKLDGKEAQLLQLDYNFHRSTDHKGRPSTQVRMTGVTVTIASDDKTKQAIIDWMATKDMGKKVEIVLYEGEDDDRKMFKTITLESTYVMSVQDSYNVGADVNLMETFTLTAEKISVGAAKFDHKWPKV
jgi:hypothetical protein